jgi:polar amino acid transport system permease protein
MGKSWPDLIAYLLPGAFVTIQATILCAPLAFVLSFLVALARRSHFRPLSFLAQAYIEVIRGTPGLLQLFYIFYALPFIGIRFLPLQAAVIGLALNYAAYGAEVFRMGFEAVPRTQIESAIALGMSPLLRMRRIIFPQAIRVIVPPLGNLLIELFKATALTSLITVDELVFRAQRLNIMTYKTVQIYTLVALFYFLMCYPSSRFFGWMEKKLAIP